MTASDDCIKRFADISVTDRVAIHAGIDQIFFAASFQTEFADTAERATFRDLWVGQYLADYPDSCLVALREATVIGYLAGYIPSAGRTGNFPGQHHMPVFQDLHAAFPAHLHVNVRTDERSVGLGACLVERFVAICRENDVCGIHVVTGNGGRNNSFYRNVGFDHEVRRTTDDRDMIFMGRRL